jgi:hypothetical protein
MNWRASRVTLAGGLLIASLLSPTGYADYQVSLRMTGAVGLKQTGNSFWLLAGDFRDPHQWPATIDLKIPPHFATLFVRDHEWAAGGGAVSYYRAACHAYGFWRAFPLRGYEIKIQGAPTTGVSVIREPKVLPAPCKTMNPCSSPVPIPRQRANISWLSGTDELLVGLPGSPSDKSLDPNLLLPSPCVACGTKLAARLAIEGGVLEPHLGQNARGYELIPFADLSYSRSPEAYTHFLEWSFTASTPLELLLTEVGTGDVVSTIQLHVPTDGLLELMIQNGPTDCHGSASDFALHYNLLSNPSALTKFPRPNPTGVSNAQCSPIEYRP